MGEGCWGWGVSGGDETGVVCGVIRGVARGMEWALACVGCGMVVGAFRTQLVC